MRIRSWDVMDHSNKSSVQHLLFTMFTDFQGRRTADAAGQLRQGRLTSPRRPGDEASRHIKRKNVIVLILRSHCFVSEECQHCQLETRRIMTDWPLRLIHEMSNSRLVLFDILSLWCCCCSDFLGDGGGSLNLCHSRSQLFYSLGSVGACRNSFLI